jgi:DNA-binding MarR family transcriptional regulator
VPKAPSRRELLAEIGNEMPGHAASAVRLNIAIAHQIGMPLADLQCMGLLTAAPAAPSQLAAGLGLTTGAMTKVLDRLERADYITRSADPSDRRRLIVTANPARLAELAARYAPMGERMSKHLTEYTTSQLQTILAFMRAGRHAADQEIMHIRQQGTRHATRQG